jgi:hypothetical protein
MLTVDEAWLISLQSHDQACQRWVSEAKRELMKEGLCAEESREDRIYIDALSQVNKTKAKITALCEHIEKTKSDLEEMKVKRDAKVNKNCLD